jgi:hypothetical protein
MWELHLEAASKMKNMVEKRRYAGRYWKSEFLELGSVTPTHRNSVSYSVADGNPNCFLEHTHPNAHTHTHTHIISII